MCLAVEDHLCVRRGERQSGSGLMLVVAGVMGIVILIVSIIGFVVQQKEIREGGHPRKEIHSLVASSLNFYTRSSN